MKYLSVKDLIYINEVVVEAGGGSVGIRDLGLIDSAANRPRATFDGEDLYLDLFSKAAALFHSLAFNHAFLDGNKRTAVAAAAQLLYLNGFRLEADEKELEDFVVQVVEEHYEVERISEWLKENAKER